LSKWRTDANLAPLPVSIPSISARTVISFAGIVFFVKRLIFSENNTNQTRAKYKSLRAKHRSLRAGPTPKYN